jgi:hypothetical protein
VDFSGDLAMVAIVEQTPRCVLGQQSPFCAMIFRQKRPDMAAASPQPGQMSRPVGGLL